MRFIEGDLPPELQGYLEQGPIDKAPAHEVGSYRELMELVAKLAYLNKDHLLFFRGQENDYRNRANASTFYPSIYRGDYLPKEEVKYKFDILNQASQRLVDDFTREQTAGYAEISRRKYIQWSILQHYGVCDTPLLDITHSVLVACSFALLDSSQGYVFVFGLPYISNRISINSEHELVNVRLLSICPPDALRPYYQDGYLAGTEDITTNYENKTELDFKNRLIAKLKISTDPDFWGEDFSGIPRTVLYPENDRIAELCKELKKTLKHELHPGEIGEFLKRWSELEEILIDKTQTSQARMVSTRKAISILSKRNLLGEGAIHELGALRRFRNQLVHRPKTVKPGEISKYMNRLAEALSYLRNA